MVLVVCCRVICQINIWGNEVKRWCEFLLDVQDVVCCVVSWIVIRYVVVVSNKWKVIVRVIVDVIQLNVGVERNGIDGFVMGCDMVQVVSVVVGYEQFICLCVFFED